MECPICDEIISDKNLFEKHIEKHKSQSVLNESRPHRPINNTIQKQHTANIDVGKFFGRERFETMISDKIQAVNDIDDLVSRRNFVEQVKKIISKHPFVYIPYFIEDLLKGISSRELLDKYHIQYSGDLKHMAERILCFDSNRYLLSQYDNAFDMNMKNPTWRKKYDILKDNCEFFKVELLELIFRNILRSFILLCIFDYVDTGISKQKILDMARTMNQHYDLFKFSDKIIEKEFLKFYAIDFEQTVNEILDELIVAKILKTKPNNPDLLVSKMSLDILKKSIVSNLKYNNGSKSQNTLYFDMKNEYPSLRLLPRLGIWETALNELNHEKIIADNSSRSRTPTVFLNENYEKIQQQLHMPETFNVEFYGRKISPDQFINEIKEIERGDFNDKDDQITRIAGLILAESVKMHAKHESIPQFDFSIDITDYHFRDEQIDAMKKLDFKIRCNIFYCKVMLDEILTLEKYDELKSSLPKDAQGLVITFEDIPNTIQTKLNEDDSIQIIDEEGMRVWVSITSKIPVRVGSIAKLHDDPISKLQKKLVRVNSLNYEDGLASVLVIPDGHEKTVLSGTLEEIIINEDHPVNFEEFTHKYAEFLDILIKITTPEDLTRGLFEIETQGRITKQDHKFTAKFEHVVSVISTREREYAFKCECLRWAEDPTSLCSHLICLLDYITRNYFLDSWNDDDNYIRIVAEHIIKKNIQVILERLEIDSLLNEEPYEKLKEFISQMSKIKEN